MILIGNQMVYSWNYSLISLVTIWLHIPIRNFAILFCSFFAKYELPNLQVDKVPELMIIVVHTNGPKRWETIRKCVREKSALWHKNGRYASSKVQLVDFGITCGVYWDDAPKFLAIQVFLAQLTAAPEGKTAEEWRKKRMHNYRQLFCLK